MVIHILISIFKICHLTQKKSLIKLAVAKIDNNNNRFSSIQINKGKVINFTREKKRTKLIIIVVIILLKKKLLSKIKEKIVH